LNVNKVRTAITRLHYSSKNLIAATVLFSSIVELIVSPSTQHGASSGYLQYWR